MLARRFSISRFERRLRGAGKLGIPSSAGLQLVMVRHNSFHSKRGMKAYKGRRAVKSSLSGVP
jgi:hypothetical protein